MLNKNKIFIAAALIFGAASTAIAQEGRVTIQQDTLIPQLLDLKTELGQANQIGDRYRIQIFSGDNSRASDIIKDFRNTYSQWTSTIVYETPNYKVWVGSFRNSLEADRALLEIKNTFPAAFRLKPERR